MKDELEMLDRALEKGHRELGLLVSGEVDEATRLAGERKALIDEAWNMRDPGKIDALKAKLLQLQGLQGQITAEAKRLHSAIKRDLLRAKQENQRLTGYRSTLRPSGMPSKFIDRVG